MARDESSPMTADCPDPDCDGACEWGDDAGWECPTCGGQFGLYDDPEWDGETGS